MKKIKIKLNGKSLTVNSNATIMEIAREQGIDIPGLCGHGDFTAKANCRVCVVEVKGMKRLVTSCSTFPAEGMEIITDSPRVKRARNTNLELIYAEHIEKCPTCIWRFECPLLKTAEKYKIKISSFRDRKGRRKTYKFANAVELDGSQCIDCRNCIDACSILQNINYLELKGKGSHQEVVPSRKKDVHCILCGQCAVHCPVSAAQEQSHYEVVERAIADKKKIVIAQFAPSIRVSIGEDFGLPYGKIVTEQVVSGLRSLGFNFVFDVSFAADVTTIVEAEELLGRMRNGGIMPMITSCCPGWVNYAEFYHPELLAHLTTARSPQIHGGGMIKTFWAKQMKIDPKRITVVSIMPCTAKKYEAARKEMKINGHFPVDHVLTTREFSYLLKKNRLDLSKLKKSSADNPLGDPTGGGVIFGGSGGVMESALRTAHYMACDNKSEGVCKTRIDFKQVRGMGDVKSAEVKVAGEKLRVAVVNGIGHIEQVIEKLNRYDYIEVMACPGGCIGGGGQPIPTNKEVREARIKALYSIDKNKKIRISAVNKNALKIMSWLKKRPGIEHKVLHTKYKKRIKY
ncbi:[FeFe] hydrogenase, group A [bacterium]|nr:[FeFe] hydrogenase, group A [bacterium]